MAIDLGSAAATLTLNVSGFVSNAKKAEDAVEAIQKSTDKAGQGIMSWAEANEKQLNKIGGALSVFGVATTGVMVGAAKVAMDFEAQMSAVAAVSGATAEEMEQAEEVVKRLGYETTLSASETAGALEELIKAGVDLEDSLDGVLGAVISLSEATGTDLMLSTETVAAAMNIFGYEAEDAVRVVDAMSQSANASALDINDWMLALKYSGPIISSLGWEIEDLAEMMIILGDAGIKGEQGATAMRNILTGLAAATPELTAEFAKYGVSLYDTNGNLREMNDITLELASSWSTMSQQEKIAFAQMVAGEQGMSSFMTIMDAQTQALDEGGSAFDRAAERMEGAGTTAESAKMRMDNLAGSLEELKGTVETIMIAFGSALTPVIRKVADALSRVLQGFLSLPEPIQQTVAVITSLVGGTALLAGGSMLAVVKVAELTKAFKELGGKKRAIEGITKALGGLRTAMLFLVANPLILGGILAITVALGALFLAYKNNWLGFGDLVDGGIGKLKEFFGLVESGPDSKNISITTTFDGDAYYIEAETLPDGTKVWHIKENDTGETFGDVLASYTDASGTTYIQIEPEGDGEAFWTSIDLETGKIDSVDIDIVATFSDPSGLAVKTITMADGTEKTLIINGDGTPVGEVIETVTADGEKKILIKPSGDGAAFWATVDLETGAIKSVDVKLNVDYGDLTHAEKQAALVEGRMRDIYNLVTLNWGDVNFSRMLGIDQLLLDLEAAYGWAVKLYNFVTGGTIGTKGKEDDYDMTPQDVANVGVTHVRRATPAGRGQMSQGGSVYTDPYNPMLGGNAQTELIAIETILDSLTAGLNNATKAAKPLARSIDPQGAGIQALGLVTKLTLGYNDMAASQGFVADQNSRTSRSFDVMSKSTKGFTDKLKPIRDFGGVGSRALRDVGISADWSGRNLAAMLISTAAGIDKTGIPAWKRFRENGDDAFSAISDAGKGLGDALGDALRDITSFDTKGSGAFSNVGKSSSDMGTKVGKAAKGATTNMRGMATDFGTAAKNAVNNALTGLQPLSGGVGTATGATPKGARGVGVGNMKGMAIDMGTQAGKVAGLVSQNMKGLGGAIGARSGVAYGGGREVGVRNMKGMKIDMAAQAKLAPEAVKTALANLGPKIGERGTDAKGAGKNVANAMRDAMNAEAKMAPASVKTALADLKTKIEEKKGDAGDGGWNVGAQVAAGMASGIWARKYLVDNAAAGVVAGLNAGLKRLLGINSPSRVMADLFKWVPAGAALGIENGTPLVQDAIKDMVALPSMATFSDMALPSYDYSLNPLRSPGYGGGYTVVDNSTHTTEYVALTEGDMQRLLARTRKAEEFVDQRTRPGGAARYVR